MMKDSIDIEKLSELARINVSPEEVQELKEDIESILGYVQEVQEVSDIEEETPQVGSVHNVMRDDKDPHESGIYTETLMKEVPHTTEEKGGIYVQVKKIL